MSANRVTKAVIPAAGRGTRFLPVTKATPKEMLPIVDKPAIQYVVEEAAAAGLTDLLMITDRNKRPLEDHFDRAKELEDALIARGDMDGLAKIREATDLATVHFVRQGDPRGLGHAILTAARFVGKEPFAVLLGDDLIDPRDAILPRMLEVQRQFGGSVIALMEVPASQISKYGAAAVKPGPAPDLLRVTNLVEKPAPGEAPSNYAIIGRYVLSPDIFAVLEDTAPGSGGEIQLTDALQVLAQRDEHGGPVHGVIFSGRRYDTGDRLSYLKTIVQIAAEREDLGPDFLNWLKDFIREER
jgi:UTP--glucose-1-phosphate uridylyltransferase